MKKIFTNGCFDVLHPGHMKLLEYCKTLGYVVVGLNSDNSVKKLKGPDRPIFSEKERIIMLKSCKYVDEVYVFNEETPYSLIKKVKPDIIVKGSDYLPHEVVGSDLCEVRIYNRFNEFSTTKIIKNIINR
jgi:D-beta-D-heptose 7-phosphate kinase/D-beta-D-heptose 1-phosphate adenosyltransferase